MLNLDFLKVRDYHEQLKDDAYINLVPNIYGFGFVMLGDAEEYAYFAFSSAGVVTLISNSANVAAADTDGKLAIFDNGTYVRVRNRLGASKDITMIIYSYK